MRAYRKLRAFLLFLSLLALQIVYEFGCKRYLFAQTLSLKIFAGALIVLLLGAALVFALFLQEGSFGKRFLRALLGYAVMAAAALLSNWLMRAITGASVWVAVWFPADILLRFFSIIVAIHLMVGVNAAFPLLAQAAVVAGGGRSCYSSVQGYRSVCVVLLPEHAGRLGHDDVVKVFHD